MSYFLRLTSQNFKIFSKHLGLFLARRITEFCPTKEVMKLKHAFEAMLSRAGIDDESKELSGPTQIHNLLEIVKKEQNHLCNH